MAASGLNERQRMAYLEAMEIAMFVPRRVLPGAAQSPQALLPPPDAQTQQSTQAHAGAPAGSDIATRTRPDALASVLEVARSPQPGSQPPHKSENPAPAEPAKPPIRPPVEGQGIGDIVNELVGRHTQQAAPPVSPHTPAATESVQFALSLWRVSQRLLVVDTRLSRQALPTQALLQNMLRAKGVVQKVDAPEIIHWPPVSGVAHAGAGGWPQAREMVLAFLQARLTQSPVAYLAVMGLPAFNAVVGDQKIYGEHLGGAVALPDLGCLALVLPSLADMLQTPALKARAWSALQPYELH